MSRIRQITGPEGQPFFYLDEDGIEPFLEAVLAGKDYPEPCPGEYKAETIVDVGAHVGSATRLFKSRYPQARVLAFEPNPAIFELLQKNLKCLAGVEAVQAGLSDFTKQARLFHGRYSSMQASVFPNEENTSQKTDILCINAAEALASHRVSCISILKLDTEGCEVPILTALQNYLPQTEVIYLEYHSEFDRRRIDSMLDRTHVLFHAAVFEPHRGTIGYIAADVLDKLHRASSRPRYAFPKTRT